MKVKGKNFVKSTYSGGSNCVGVSMELNKVSVVNTKEGQTIVEFTNDEWQAFIRGVKHGEFDIKKD